MSEPIKENEPVVPPTPSIKGKRGKKPMFTMALAERIYHCARFGMTGEQIGWTLGFSEDALSKWLKSSETFRNKYDDALNHADGVIERSFYHRAKGMKVTERTVEEVSEAGGVDDHGTKLEDKKRTKKVVVEKEIPPDTSAAIKWLMNRRPEKWRDNPNVVIQQDNRKQLMINFNAEEVANLILNEYPSHAKAISDAVRQVIGIGVESNNAATGQPLSEPERPTV